MRHSGPRIRLSFPALALSLTFLCQSSSPADPVQPPANPPSSPAVAVARQKSLRNWSDAKFGLFLHWGVYSLYGGTYKGQELWSAEWIQENARIPFDDYARTAAAWNPQGFDADALASAARNAGMRYIVITAKHHDGFAIYPTKASSYHLFASGACTGPDPLASLKKACSRQGLLFGIYYSPLEFRGSPKGFDQEDEKAVAAGFDYRTLGPAPYATDRQIASKAKAQIRELAEWYRPDILWFDGTWNQMGNWTESDARETEAMVRSIVPDVLINNRLGLKHWDFNTYENEIPSSPPGGHWEYCWNMGAFWGYNPRNYTPELMKTPDHYIETLARISSLGGNYLLNVGPDADGRLHPMAADYLQKIGAWVKPNRAAFEGVSPSPFKEMPVWGFATCREGKLYLIIRSSSSASTVSIPALGNRLRDARLLADPATKVSVTTGDPEWRIGPVPAPKDGPFVVVELSIDGSPEPVTK